MGLTGLKSRYLQGCIIFLKALGENLISSCFLFLEAALIPWLRAPLHLQNRQWPVQSFSDHIPLTLILPFPILLRTLGMKITHLGYFNVS